MSRRLKTQNGFTLVEMLIAIAIFVLFTGLILTSYLGVVRSLHDTESFRILYAEARNGMDVITEMARSSRFYGPDDAVFRADTLGCLGGEKGPVFYSSDYSKTDAVCFDQSAQKVIIREFKNGVSTDVDGQILNSSSVYVKDFDAEVFPKDNPYSADYAFNPSTYFQPKVTFTVIFAKKDTKGDELTVDLSTTISSRFYD